MHSTFEINTRHTAEQMLAADRHLHTPMELISQATYRQRLQASAAALLLQDCRVLQSAEQGFGQPQDLLINQDRIADSASKADLDGPCQQIIVNGCFVIPGAPL